MAFSRKSGGVNSPPPPGFRLRLPHYAVLFLAGITAWFAAQNFLAPGGSTSPARPPGIIGLRKVQQPEDPPGVEEDTVFSPPRGAAPVVCMLGNAQNVDMAREMSAFWPDYHAFWAIWGQPADVVRSQQTDHTWAELFGNHGVMTPSRPVVFHPFPCPKGACPWKYGMEMALGEARASGVPCEYYFTSDDDSDWYRSDTVPSDTNAATPKPLVGGSVCDELTHVLRTYRPAVASFGWEYGDTKFDGARALVQAAGSDAVSVLTAYDNGNALYHASVIDFIVPFGPSGEGGFVGNWTLPASWLNMLVPFAFQSHVR